MAAKKKTADATTAPEGSTAIAELPVEQRAELVLSFEATAAHLRGLVAESATLTKVDTDDNLAAAKSAARKLATARVAVEKTGKAARDDANKFRTAVIAKEKSLVDILKPEEDRIGAMIDAEVRRRAAAEQAAREEEARRAAAIREAFAELRAMPERAKGADLARIDALIGNAQAIVDDQSGFPEDLRAAARYEAQVALAACKAARDARVQADADAAELEQLRAERAERERRAAENAAEASRAAGVVSRRAAVEPPRPCAAKVYQPDDDDLPPGHEPAPAAVPAVPVARVVPLLQAARNALSLLDRSGLGHQPEALELRAAIREAGGA